MEEVVFFGSGPVAAKSLGLLAKSFAIEAIITKTSTTKIMHLASPNSPIFEVNNRAELDKLVADKKFNAKLGILIDFGIIVNQKVIDSFPLGIINSHFSLLPELRGADPISFAILGGLSRTGVSLMLLNDGLDEGPILTVGIENLSGAETAPELTERLIKLSDSLLKKTIPTYLNNYTAAINQADIANQIENYPTKPSYSRKLTKQDGVIDWNKPAEQIEREVRAFTEWPKSHTTIEQRDVVITKVKVSQDSTDPGKIKIDGQKLLVGSGRGSIEIIRLKPVGKQEMSASDFVRGYLSK